MTTPPAFNEETPVRISFGVDHPKQGREILEHLAEERLIAGGNVIHAQAINWVGGEMIFEQRKVVSCYTTSGKLQTIRVRMEIFFDGETPELSQFVMTGNDAAVDRWIERNVRE